MASAGQGLTVYIYGLSRTRVNRKYMALAGRIYMAVAGQGLTLYIWL